MTKNFLKVTYSNLKDPKHKRLFAFDHFNSLKLQFYSYRLNFHIFNISNFKVRKEEMSGSFIDLTRQTISCMKREM